jgi:spermidine/putrescine transport system ATP-binding protein
MQLELKTLNQELGTTFIYVTHDQEEALTMSDRIAVMDMGRVAQLGTPAEIYENPRTAFVAEFIGQANFFEGQATKQGNGQWLIARAGGGAFRVPQHSGVLEGGHVCIAVRPEWMDVWRPDAVPAGENALLGTIRDIIYLGETVHVIVTVPGTGDVTVAVRNQGQLMRPVAWKPGESAAVAWLPEHCRVLEPDP